MKNDSKKHENYLDKMIEHEFGNPNSTPFWMSENVSDVGLLVTEVWYEKCKTDHQLFVAGHAAEVGILERL